MDWGRKRGSGEDGNIYIVVRGYTCSDEMEIDDIEVAHSAAWDEDTKKVIRTRESFRVIHCIDVMEGLELRAVTRVFKDNRPSIMWLSVWKGHRGKRLIQHLIG